MNYLIYVNELGPNYKGENIYEFIFSDNLEGVWGDSWESKPSNGYPSPPDIINIKKVGVLKNNLVSLSVIQNSDYFAVTDAMEDVIALAWETDESCENEKRLVFKFGDSEDTIKDKLYERDLLIHFEKEEIYES